MKTCATLDDVRKVELPQVSDTKGNLTFVEQYDHAPFKVKNVSWLYDIAVGERLDGYSLKRSEQLIIVLSGNVDVVLSDGKNERVFFLNRSYEGLYVPPMIWLRMENVSTNSLTLVISSSDDLENEYIRAFESFLPLKKNA